MSGTVRLQLLPLFRSQLAAKAQQHSCIGFFQFSPRLFRVGHHAAEFIHAKGAAAQAAAAQDSQGKNCRMEQQCHWQDFKKICVWVKVCR